MAKLATGSGMAKIIGLFTAPVITRIYLPEHFGVLSVFAALVGLLIPLGTLRYCMAIPLPKSDATATNLTALALTALLIVSSLSLAVFGLFGPLILQKLSMEQLIPYWWLIPIAIVGTGSYQLLTQWAVREKGFKSLAQTKVWQKIIGSVIKIGLGLAGLKPLGLLIGQIFTQAGGILTLFRSFRSKLSDNWKHVNRYRMNFLFKRYSDFPKYRLPSQFLLVLATKAPLLFFAWHFGAHTTGQFGLALMIVALPLDLLGQSIGKAYYAEIAKIAKNKPKIVYEITINILKKLFMVSIPPFLVLILFGPSLFQFVFGSVWREAGVFASQLALYLISQFLFNPIGNALTVFRRQDLILVIHSIRLTAVILVFLFSLALNLTPSLTVLFYSFALFLNYAAGCYITVSYIQKYKLK